MFPHEEKKIKGGQIDWDAHGGSLDVISACNSIYDMVIMAYASGMHFFFLLSHWSQISQWNCLYKG